MDDPDNYSPVNTNTVTLTYVLLERTKFWSPCMSN